MEIVRDILAGLLALTAAVLLTLWAPTGWVRDDVVDAAGFQAIAAPLGEDAAFQRTVSDAGVQAVLDQLEVPRLLRDRVEPALADQAARITGTDAFAEIWSGTTQDLHARLMDPAGGTVSADLNPYVDELVQPEEDLVGRDIEIPDTGALQLPIATIPASPWADRIRAMGEASSLFGIAGLVCAAASLLLAAHRGVMAFLLGLAVGLGGLALLLVSRGIGVLVPDAADGSGIIGALMQTFEQRFTADMMLPSMIQIGAGALLIVVSLLALGIAGGRRRA